jgi:hypothetical protein
VIRTHRQLGIRIAVTVVLLAAAALMWHHMPTKLQTWAPISVNAQVGERAQGRDLAVTVHRVGLARALTTTTSTGELQNVPATAVWLVLAVTYEGLHSVDPVPKFELEATGRTYTNYVQTLDSFQLVGVPERGVIAFELPEVPRAAVLTATNQVLDKYRNELRAPLDSQITVPIDLSTTAVQSGTAVVDTIDLDEWKRP